ncbi:MAG: hypothetical protein GC150_16400 [Rhizobiales bacterium]|nr:hypothetical protein [Hyphomicrobiales bacterium]
MDAARFGRGIAKGLGVNLLVADVERALAFHRDVLASAVVYSDPDFAILTNQGAMYMLHADHTYLDNPVSGLVAGLEGRGAGVELRLYGCDPDDAEARARAGEHIVLAGSMDKPHGLRECCLIDPDGYLWVPSVALG